MHGPLRQRINMTLKENTVTFSFIAKFWRSLPRAGKGMGVCQGNMCAGSMVKISLLLSFYSYFWVTKSF